MTKKSSSGKAAKRAAPTGKKAPTTSKLETLVMLLRTPSGATIHELAAATSWQTHSVRGALAGTLKKKGHSITSEKVDGTRRYRIQEAQA